MPGKINNPGTTTLPWPRATGAPLLMSLLSVMTGYLAHVYQKNGADRRTPLDLDQLE